MRCVIAAATIISAVMALPMSSVTAADYEVGEIYTGLKVGLIGSGSVDLERHQIDQRTGPSAGFFFDQPFGSIWHYGLSIDFYRMAWREKTIGVTLDESEWLLDLGVNLKANIVSESWPLGFRPGVGVGVAFLGRMDMAGVAGSSYVTLKAFTEVVYLSAAGLGYVVEGGIWYAPSGGDNTTDVTLGPLLSLRAGVMF
ncbi:MAG: hypothetical protein AB1772_09605 [Candidatus Zixiibacteriota bacterium]